MSLNLSNTYDVLQIVMRLLEKRNDISKTLLIGFQNSKKENE